MNSFPEVRIGIIGLGFVGSAILNSLSDRFIDLIIIDPDKGHNSTYNDLVGAEAVFVCVPTPRNDDGNCDTSILKDVLDRLHKIKYTGVIISKCTAPPSVYQKLNEQYPNLVHVPEFLTAADAMRDYLNGSFAIIGGKITAYRNEAERFTKISQQNLKTIVHCDIGEAALTKYAINSFLATKVVFMNELYRVAETAGLDYNVIATMIKLDPRIGDSHMRVPGPDGTFGFGGHCFPKDTEALLSLSKDLGVTMQVLESALKKNLLLRLS